MSISKNTKNTNDSINNLLNSINNKKITKIHQYNSKCYRFVKQTYDSGLFDSCIDSAYVLIMENSSRLPEIQKQLTKHKPSSTVMMQYNQGFRKCKKQLQKQASNYDLVDAYRNIFIHALASGYQSILVMEDDFFMDKYNNDDIERICKFIRTKHPDVYNLGALGCIGTFIGTLQDSINYHYKCTVSSSSHGVIYRNSYMKEFIKKASYGKIIGSDQFPNDKKYNVYTYYKPIAFQLIPETENSKNWDNAKAQMFIFKKLKLDKTNENFRLKRDIERYAPFWCTLLGIIILIIIIIIFLLCKRNKQTQ